MKTNLLIAVVVVTICVVGIHQLTKQNTSLAVPAQSALTPSTTETAPMLPEERLKYTQRQVVAGIQDRFDSDSILTRRVHVTVKDNELVLDCRISEAYHEPGTPWTTEAETSNICSRALTVVSNSRKI